MTGTDTQLPGMEDHPDSRGVYLEMWVLDLVECDYPVAILLRQLMWWHQPAKDGGTKLAFQRDGQRWLVRRDEDWQRDTRLSPRQVQRARKVLVGLGLIEVRRLRFNGAPTCSYRPLLDAIRAARQGGTVAAVPGPRDAQAPAPDLTATPVPTYAPASVPLSLLGRSKDLEVIPIAASAAIDKPSRPRNLPFEALCGVCGIDWNELTDVERRRITCALKAIRGAWKGGTDGDLAHAIVARAAHFRAAWDVPLTAMALAGRWASCAHPVEVGRRSSGGDRPAPHARGAAGLAEYRRQRDDERSRA